MGGPCCLAPQDFVSAISRQEVFSAVGGRSCTRDRILLVLRLGFLWPGLPRVAVSADSCAHGSWQSGFAVALGGDSWKGQQNLKKRWCKTNWSLNGWSWKQPGKGDWGPLLSGRHCWGKAREPGWRPLPREMRRAKRRKRICKSFRAKPKWENDMIMRCRELQAVCLSTQKTKADLLEVVNALLPPVRRRLRGKEPRPGNNSMERSWGSWGSRWPSEESSPRLHWHSSSWTRCKANEPSYRTSAFRYAIRESWFGICKAPGPMQTCALQREARSEKRGLTGTPLLDKAKVTVKHLPEHLQLQRSKLEQFAAGLQSRSKFKIINKY